VLRTIIIDDEQPTIDMLKMSLLITADVEVIGVYTKASEVLKNIKMLKTEVVFFDVEILGVNGFELGEHILEQDVDLDSMFVKAFCNYDVETFELDATLKLSLKESVERTISRLLTSANLRTSVVNQKAQIFSLGKFEVRKISEGKLIKWRTAKVEELFAYLLYHQGSIVPKGKIIENLWDASETANNNLHTSVYRLKKTLRENEMDISISFSGGGYILHLGENIAYDVNEFKNFIGQSKTINRNTIKEFEKNIVLYQGDYLENKDYLWCETERFKLQKSYTNIVKQMARYYLEVTEYVKAEHLLLKTIEYTPYDEESYEILLQMFFLQDNRVAVIKYYENLKVILNKELGIEPRPSLKCMYEKMIQI